MEFADGDAVAPLAVVGDAAGKKGTEVTFTPSKATFTMVEFDFATLEHRLRELAFLNSGVTIVLSDMRHAVEKREEMRYEGGIEEFVRYLDRNKSPLVPAPPVPSLPFPSRSSPAYLRSHGRLQLTAPSSIDRVLPREPAIEESADVIPAEFVSVRRCRQHPKIETA